MISILKFISVINLKLFILLLFVQELYSKEPGGLIYTCDKWKGNVCDMHVFCVLTKLYFQLTFCTFACTLMEKYTDITDRKGNIKKYRPSSANYANTVVEWHNKVCSQFVPVRCMILLDVWMRCRRGPSYLHHLCLHHISWFLQCLIESHISD